MQKLISVFLVSLVLSLPALAQEEREDIYDYYDRMKKERASNGDDDSYKSSYDDPFDVSPLKSEDRVRNINKTKRSYQRFDNGISDQTKSSQSVLEKMMSEY